MFIIIIHNNVNTEINQENNQKNIVINTHKIISVDCVDFFGGLFLSSRQRKDRK